jgi:hypothetical protein
LAFFLVWEIYDICPLIDLSHDDVVISFTSFFDYLSFNLIIQHILFFAKKNGITKIMKKKGHGVPSPLSLKCCALIIQNN